MENTNNIEELRILYNKLSDEYNEYKLESDDICKEYESTIQILTDSLDSLKLQNTNLSNENKIYKENNKQLIEELNSIKIKNKDKMNDIELLNNKLDKLCKEYNKIKESKTLLNSKMIDLENDNEKYIGKIRQYESQIEDLKLKLEETMEDLITKQIEFDEYKKNSEEIIQRYKQNLNDEINNNDVIKKNLILKLNEDKNEKNEEKKRLHRAYSLIIPHNFNFIIQKMRSRKEEIIKFKNNIQKEITQFFF